MSADRRKKSRGPEPQGGVDPSPSPSKPTDFGKMEKLSRETRTGLKGRKYVTPTAVQKEVLPPALGGRDVLCAAKTGSGKTLAFVIPVLEKLDKEKWSARVDGIGALILTPTRELALQIFEEVKSVGKKHRLSVGLLIGGSGRKTLEEEKARAGNLNILIATPGRLLQHMDETPYFDCGGLKILVLDEADRILDMGFRATLDAILENLPRERQTLLFSATQTKSVQDLARLNLSDPEYISIHADAVVPTPVKLQQAFVECPCSQKISVLWGFIKTHLKSKVLVFFSTCKQARFVSKAFSKLRPGVPLRCLHGHMKQMKRVATYEYFARTKEIVLFATDVAARGLDFPDVDWVIQFDCPDDVPTYIHRVGRTARYLSGGRSLMLLLPSEKPGMVAALEEKKVPIKEIKINPQKHQDITQSMIALLAKWAELKEFAKSGLVSYIKSVHLSPSKAIFDLNKMDLAQLSRSYGLAQCPRLRWLNKTAKGSKSGSGSGREAAGGAEEDKLAGLGVEGDSDGGEDGGEFELKSEQPEMPEPLSYSDPSTLQRMERERRKKVKIKDSGQTNVKAGKRTVFDEDGAEQRPFAAITRREGEEGEDGDHGAGGASVLARFDLLKSKLKESDVEDKRILKERKRLAKRKRKAAKRGESGDFDDEDEDEDEAPRLVVTGANATALSVEDQEALALKLLS